MGKTNCAADAAEITDAARQLGKHLLLPFFVAFRGVAARTPKQDKIKNTTIVISYYLAELLACKLTLQVSPPRPARKAFLMLLSYDRQLILLVTV